MSIISKTKKKSITPSTIAKVEFPEPDQSIVIEEITGRKKRTITGTVDHVYETFISVNIKGESLKESFLKVDFLTGDLKLV